MDEFQCDNRGDLDCQPDQKEFILDREDLLSNKSGQKPRLDQIQEKTDTKHHVRDRGFRDTL